MTREDKLDGILERLKEIQLDFDPRYISVIVIVGYLDDLSKKGLIENAFAISSSGKDVRAICEEFDWKPTDEEIHRFVIEMVEEAERIPFVYMIKRYRDDREKFLNEFENHKKSLDGVESS